MNGWRGWKIFEVALERQDVPVLERRNPSWDSSSNFPPKSGSRAFGNGGKATAKKSRGNERFLLLWETIKFSA